MSTEQSAQLQSKSLRLLRSFSASNIRESSQKVLDYVRNDPTLGGNSTEIQLFSSETRKKVYQLTSKGELTKLYAAQDLISALSIIDDVNAQITLLDIFDTNRQLTINPNRSEYISENGIRARSVQKTDEHSINKTNRHSIKKTLAPIKERKALQHIKKSWIPDRIVEQIQSVLINPNTHIFPETIVYMMENGYDELALKILGNNDGAGLHDKLIIEPLVVQTLKKNNSLNAAYATAALFKKLENNAIQFAHMSGYAKVPKVIDEYIRDIKKAQDPDLINTAIYILESDIRERLKTLGTKAGILTVIDKAVKLNTPLAYGAIEKEPELRQNDTKGPATPEEIDSILEDLPILLPEDSIDKTIESLRILVGDLSGLPAARGLIQLQSAVQVEARKRVEKIVRQNLQDRIYREERNRLEAKEKAARDEARLKKAKEEKKETTERIYSELKAARKEQIILAGTIFKRLNTEE